MYPDSGLNLNYETDDAVYWFSTAFEPLNNWSAHAVKIWDKKFPTIEHAFHYRKFAEAAPDVAEKIINAPSPWAAMQVERQNKDRRREDWRDVKVDIMTNLIRAKVAQNLDVKECLLKTGDKKIIENSPWDSFWGVGSDGQGENMTGKILMKVREEVKREKK